MRNHPKSLMMIKWQPLRGQGMEEGNSEQLEDYTPANVVGQKDSPGWSVRPEKVQSFSGKPEAFGR
jgi:hypothetical protein